MTDRLHSAAGERAGPVQVGKEKKKRSVEKEKGNGVRNWRKNEHFSVVKLVIYPGHTRVQQLRSHF